MSDRTHIFITANSPGEIAGWVAPVVDEIKRKDASAGVTVVVTPCQYASGSEIQVASSLPGVDRAVKFMTLAREIVFGGLTRGSLGPGSRVLYLGGDAAYAVMLSKLLRLPASAYLGKPRWRKHLAMYMVPDDRAERRFADAGIGPERVRVVGHLGLDSVPIRENQSRRMEDDAPIVTFLPGSRPFEIEFMLPFFIETAEIMRERVPDARFHFAVSQFADRKLIVKCMSRVGARMGSNGDVVSASGCRIRLETENPWEIMGMSRLVVTIPGTNNLQLAAMGVPMLIVTPLNVAERIPVDGILGLLDYRIFPIGLIKRHLIQSKRGRVKYVSLPNIIAGREIVPEMLDILQPCEVAERAASLLNDPDRCAEMVRDLAEIAGHGGAARRIAELILGEEAAVTEGVGSP